MFVPFKLRQQHLNLHSRGWPLITVLSISRRGHEYNRLRLETHSDCLICNYQNAVMFASANCLLIIIGPVVLAIVYVYLHLCAM